jgi:hypothetical protein
VGVAFRERDRSNLERKNVTTTVKGGLSWIYIYMCQIVTAKVEQIMLIGHDVNKNIGHK